MFILVLILLFYIRHLYKFPKKKGIDPSLHLYFGLPGSGKSTYASLIVDQCQKANIPVYCNFPVKGTYQFDPVSDLGKHMLENCVLIIDEGGLVFNNRDFAKFSKSNLEFFKLHRHYNTEIHIFSQGINDCDIKIRQLAQKIFYIERCLMPYSRRIRRVKRYLGIDENGQLIDKYDFVPFSKKLIWLPSFWNMFDSFNKPIELVERSYSFIEPLVKPSFGTKCIPYYNGILALQGLLLHDREQESNINL